ncbi:MAG: methyltransferase domain-containing protein [Deltaproteobacteria bacterium]|nr:methyltransferase domain-containing protein [Deltaproteobacteria bacterium]
MRRVLEPEVMDTEEESIAYEAMDHHVVNGAFVDRLVERGANGRMLDLGTGPAHIPVLVCERIPSAHVVATDLADTMLSLARARIARARLSHKVELVKVDVKKLPFEDRAFDVVFSNTVLHHLPDPRPFLREAVRVLRPEGILMIRDLRRPETEAELLALVEKHTANDSAGQRALFRASLCASFTPAELWELDRELALGAQVVVTTDRHVTLER